MVEALWLGKALIMTDVSGARDVLGSDNDRGILVPSASSAALTSAMLELAADPGLRTRLGEAAAQHVRSTLSIDAVIPLYERAYLDLVG
jgi:glycosyltransferase involved in cell wall biosynthesis